MNRFLGLPFRWCYRFIVKLNKIGDAFPNM